MVLREHTQRSIDFSPDGTGFIIGPCHNPQPNTPLGNIIALYEEAWSNGAEAVATMERISFMDITLSSSRTNQSG